MTARQVLIHHDGRDDVVIMAEHEAVVGRRSEIYFALGQRAGRSGDPARAAEWFRKAADIDSTPGRGSRRHTPTEHVRVGGLVEVVPAESSAFAGRQRGTRPRGRRSVRARSQRRPIGCFERGPARERSAAVRPSTSLTLGGPQTCKRTRPVLGTKTIGSSDRKRCPARVPSVAVGYGASPRSDGHAMSRRGSRECAGRPWL